MEKKPTAAQRKVLEAMRDGRVLHQSTTPPYKWTLRVVDGWPTWLRASIPNALLQLKLIGLIGKNDLYFDYVLTDLGRAALTAATPTAGHEKENAG